MMQNKEHSNQYQLPQPTLENSLPYFFLKHRNIQFLLNSTYHFYQNSYESNIIVLCKNFKFEFHEKPYVFEFPLINKMNISLEDLDKIFINMLQFGQQYFKKITPEDLTTNILQIIERMYHNLSMDIYNTNNKNILIHPKIYKKIEWFFNRRNFFVDDLFFKVSHLIKPHEIYAFNSRDYVGTFSFEENKNISMCIQNCNTIIYNDFQSLLEDPNFLPDERDSDKYGK